MSDDNKPVGYGVPPTHSQWKPGQSGNPSGRPKKSVRLIEVLLEEANSLITITENGQVQTVPKLRAMVKSLSNRALKGDVRAMALFWKMWSPSEIESLEWYEEQRLRSTMKAIADGMAIMKRLQAGDAIGKPSLKEDDDPEWEAFRKDQDEAGKKGELLTWDDWQERNGPRGRFIGET